MKTKLLMALTLACTAALAEPAWADDCGPLKMLMSVDLTPAPGSNSRFLVPVIVNNVPQKFLLNTAGQFTTLNATAAQALNLHPIGRQPRPAAGFVRQRIERICPCGHFPTW
jgi:hypothetical protein